jgi:hypothetical protein
MDEPTDSSLTNRVEEKPPTLFVATLFIKVRSSKLLI